MKTAFKAALISAALAAVAAPAMAQDRGYRDHDRGYDRPQASQGFVRVGYELFHRLDSIQDRIERKRTERRMSRQDAERASREVREIRDDLTRATSGRSRLSATEESRFNKRIDRVGGFVLQTGGR